MMHRNSLVFRFIIIEKGYGTQREILVHEKPHISHYRLAVQMKAHSNDIWIAKIGVNI